MGETFSEERESITDEGRSGRPATSRTEENIAKVRQIVRENRRLTARMKQFASHSSDFHEI